MSPAPDYEALVRQLRQARHISRCHEADLDRARSELVATRARAATFASQQETALRRLAALEQALAQVQAEETRLTPLSPAQSAVNPETSEASLRAEIARLEQHRDEARLLRGSLSWRVTRSLRALRRPRRTLRILIDRLRS